MGLQDMTLALQTTGLLLTAETQSAIPSWSEYRWMAAKRRTILASHMLMWAWSLMHRYPPFVCREVSFMPSPAPKILWQASSSGWHAVYSHWLERWQDGGPHCLEELTVAEPDIFLDARTQRWLEEADEFGLLLMSQGQYFPACACNYGLFFQSTRSIDSKGIEMPETTYTRNSESISEAKAPVVDSENTHIYEELPFLGPDTISPCIYSLPSTRFD